MIVTAPTLQTTRYRLARHYLGKLRAAAAAFRQGHENSTYGLTLFDRDWPQIKQWQAWSAARADQDTAAASVCAEYPQAGAEILALRQSPQERIEWLEIGLKAAQLQGDQKRELVQLYYLALTHRDQKSTAAEEYASKAVNLARTLGDKRYVGRSLVLLGEINRMSNHYPAAQSFLEEGLAVLLKAGTRADLGLAYRGLGLLAWVRGDWLRSRDYQIQSLAIATELGREVEICNVLVDLSLPTWVLGDLSGARIYLEQCIARCRAIGYHRVLALSLNILAQSDEELGQLAEARQHYEEAIAIGRTMGILWDMSSALRNYGDLLYKLGDYAAALNHLEESLVLARAQSNRSSIAVSLRFLVEVYGKLGDLDRARRNLHEGLMIIRDFNVPLRKAHMIMTAVSLWQDRGKVAQAAEWLGTLLNFPDLPEQEQGVVQNLRERFEAELSNEQITAAIDRGKTLNLDDVIAAALAELDDASAANGIASV
jgi:tetratricopeptide (TPR) repeat protein